MSGRFPRCWAAGFLIFLLSGCASLHSNESALNPAGPQAQQISRMFWSTLGVGVVVWIAVMLTLGAAMARRDREKHDTPDLNPEPRAERRRWVFVSSSLILTTVVLFVILIGEFAAGRALHRFADQSQPFIALKVTGHQWWWEVQYKDITPSNNVTTANEIYIPVGKRVEVELSSTLGS